MGQQLKQGNGPRAFVEGELENEVGGGVLKEEVSRRNWFVEAEVTMNNI